MSCNTQEDLARRRFSEPLDTVLPRSALEELRQRYGPARIKLPKQPPPEPPLPSARQQPPVPPARPPLVDSSRGYSRLILGGLGAAVAIAALAIMFGTLARPSGRPAVQAPVVVAPDPAAPAPMVQPQAVIAPTPAASIPAPIPAVPMPTPQSSATPSSEPSPAATPSSDWDPHPPVDAFLPQPVVSAPRAELVLYKRWAGNGMYLLTDSTGRAVKILADPAPRAELVGLPVGGQIAIPLPFGETRLCTFRGVVPTFDDLPSSGAPNDFWIAKDSGIPWVWIDSARGGIGTWIDPVL